MALGAVHKDGALAVSVPADEAWKGKLLFESPRHKTGMKLPVDRPRIDRIPEWFIVEAGKRYAVIEAPSGAGAVRRGPELLEGIPLEPAPGEVLRLEVRRIE